MVAFIVTISLPERFFCPVQPSDAIQRVASVEFQDRVEVAPTSTRFGRALKSKVGVGGGVTGGITTLTVASF